MKKAMKKLFLILFLLFPAISHAKIYILIEEASSRKFPIAVPQFLTDTAGQNSFTRSATSLIKKDLEIAGLFKVLDEDSFVQKDHDVDRIDFTKWNTIEAHALVKGIVDSRGGKTLLELRLYDTETHELLVGKQYYIKKQDYVLAIHKFTDEILKALTGLPGPFSSRVAAACGKQPQRQIHAFSIDGEIHGSVTKLKANNISPNWSPDGGSIVFTSFIKYYPEIFRVATSGKGLKQLTSNNATNITPSYSPQGGSIAFASSRTGDTELYLMSGSGKITSRLTSVLNIDVSPTWSPDGSRLVFASERSGNLHLFMMAASGGGTTRLTYTGYQNDQPDWSPDGQKIVFTARDRGAFDIFMMNADGSMIQRLTRDEGNNESPTWSPDSRYIVFSSARRGGAGVYVMMDDGSNQMLIPNTGGCINPDWGPRI